MIEYSFDQPAASSHGVHTYIEVLHLYPVYLDAQSKFAA